MQSITLSNKNKLLTLFFAMILAIGLIPSAAFATGDAFQDTSDAAMTIQDTCPFQVSGGTAGSAAGEGDYYYNESEGILHIQTSTPLVISTGGVQVSSSIQIDAGVKADITLDNVDILTSKTGAIAPINMVTNTKPDGTKAAHADEIVDKTMLHLTLADGSTNRLECANQTFKGTGSPAIRCGWGSILVIDDSVRNVDESNQIITPENGKIGSDVVLSNGTALKAGDPLAKMDSTNPGKLYVRGGAHSAGIGSGAQENAGTLIFNGGVIEAHASSTANVDSNTGAAIGSGDGGSGTTIIINGGSIDAYASYHGSAIGCGWGYIKSQAGQPKSDAIPIPSKANDAGYGYYATYSNTTQFFNVAGDIFINGGFVKAAGAAHGNAIGKACHGTRTTNRDHIIKITGGTVLPSSASGCYDIGGQDGYVVITGGSVICAKSKFQGIGNTAYNTVGIESFDDIVNTYNKKLPDGDKVAMITIDLKSELAGNLNAPITYLRLKVAGVDQNYGAPYCFSDGKLYLWLPDSAAKVPNSVDLDYIASDGKTVQLRDLYRNPGQAGNYLKRYMKFNLPDTSMLTKYYDGKAIALDDIKTSIIGTELSEISSGSSSTVTFHDPKKVSFRFQPYKTFEGDVAGEDVEVTTTSKIIADAGVGMLTVLSMEYAEDAAYKNSYWGHWAREWVEIKSIGSQIALEGDPRWVTPDQAQADPSLHTGLNMACTIKRADIDPLGNPTAKTCAAPEGYVQIYLDGQAIGEPQKIVFDESGQKAEGCGELLTSLIQTGEDGAKDTSLCTFTISPEKLDSFIPGASNSATNHTVSVKYLPSYGADTVTKNYTESDISADKPVEIKLLAPETSVGIKDLQIASDGTPLTVIDTDTGTTAEDGTTVHSGTLSNIYSTFKLGIRSNSSAPITLTESSTDGDLIKASFSSEVLKQDDGTYVHILTIDPQTIGSDKLSFAQPASSVYTPSVWNYEVDIQPNPYSLEYIDETAFKETLLSDTGKETFAKTYDGTDTLGKREIDLSATKGLLEGHTNIKLTYEYGVYDSANAGENALTLHNVRLEGGDAWRYSLSGIEGYDATNKTLKVMGSIAPCPVELKTTFVASQGENAGEVISSWKQGVSLVDANGNLEFEPVFSFSPDAVAQGSSPEDALKEADVTLGYSASTQGSLALDVANPQVGQYFITATIEGDGVSLDEEGGGYRVGNFIYKPEFSTLEVTQRTAPPAISITIEHDPEAFGSDVLTTKKLTEIIESALSDSISLPEVDPTVRITKGKNVLAQIDPKVSGTYSVELYYEDAKGDDARVIASYVVKNNDKDNSDDNQDTADTVNISTRIKGDIDSTTNIVANAPSVVKGDTYTIAIEPGSLRYISSIEVDGQEIVSSHKNDVAKVQLEGNELIFTDVSDPHSVVITVSKAPSIGGSTTNGWYTIASNVYGSPEGITGAKSAVVNVGADSSISWQVKPGYAITDIVIDDKTHLSAEQIANGSYAFNGVNANHVVDIYCKHVGGLIDISQADYFVTTRIEGGPGTITSGSHVKPGSDYRIDWDRVVCTSTDVESADYGVYELDHVSVNGVKRAGSGDDFLNLSNIRVDKTVTAHMRPVLYNVTTQTYSLDGTGAGSIAPSKTLFRGQGYADIWGTPADGSRIVRVVVDDKIVYDEPAPEAASENPENQEETLEVQTDEVQEQEPPSDMNSNEEGKEETSYSSGITSQQPSTSEPNEEVPDEKALDETEAVSSSEEDTVLDAQDEETALGVELLAAAFGIHVADEGIFPAPSEAAGTMDSSQSHYSFSGIDTDHRVEVYFASGEAGSSSFTQTDFDNAKNATPKVTSQIDGTTGVLNVGTPDATGNTIVSWGEIPEGYTPTSLIVNGQEHPISPGSDSLNILLPAGDNTVTLKTSKDSLSGDNVNPVAQDRRINAQAGTFYSVDTKLTGGKGTITVPADVPAGIGYRVSWAADSGYHIAKVMVDGVERPDLVSANFVDFANLDADHTVEVELATDDQQEADENGNDNSQSQDGVANQDLISDEANKDTLDENGTELANTADMFMLKQMIAIGLLVTCSVCVFVICAARKPVERKKTK